MNIPVIWLPPDKQHDQNQFKLIFDGKFWKVKDGYQFTHYESVTELENDHGRDGAVMVVPTKYYEDKIDWLNQEINKLKWVLLIFTGNEEGTFPLEEIQHPSKKIYYTTPHIFRTKLDLVDRLFGDGYAPPAEMIGEMTDEFIRKDLDVYFGGQVTHNRREQAVDAMHTLQAQNPELKVEMLETAGFYQGFDDPRDYYKRLVSAKIAPCPSGPETPDTFRLYEALQAMALPIGDTRTPKDEAATNYWGTLFGEEPPFPLIRDDWQSMPEYTRVNLADWPRNVNRATAWWINQKRRWAQDVRHDLSMLTGDGWKSSRRPPHYGVDESITVVVPISPIASHPETTIIEETVANIRVHLPHAEIWLLFDGVRGEQEERRADYEEHIRRVLWKCLHEWSNVRPVIFEEHQHQSGMLKKVIDQIETPAMLFVEADTPITPDMEIPWGGMVRAVVQGEANLIRLHHEALILPDHEHLMLDTEPRMVGEDETILNYSQGLRMRRTQQWSQRPHVASTAYYKRILSQYFSPDSRAFIEDRMYGILEGEVKADGEMGWLQHRIWIYEPEGNNIKRSYHLDGRAGRLKYDDTQEY